MEESATLEVGEEEEVMSCSTLSVVECEDRSQGDGGGTTLHQTTVELNDVNVEDQEKENEQSASSPHPDKEGVAKMSGIGTDCINNDHEEITSVDRAGSVISGLGTCSSVNGDCPIDSEISAYNSILLDPESLPHYAKTPSLMNDEKSMQSNSTKPDPPPSIAGDSEMVSLNETIESRPHRLQEEATESSNHVEELTPDENIDTTQESSIQQPRDASASALIPENGSLSKFLESALDDSDDVETRAANPSNLERNSGENSSIEEANGTLTDSSAYVMPRETGMTVGPDNLQLLPAVEEERLQLPPGDGGGYASAFASLQQPHLQHVVPVSGFSQPSRGSVSSQLSGTSNNDRRKIQFRLQEDVLMKTSHKRSSSLLGSIRKNSTRMLQFGRGETTSTLDGHAFPVYKSVDRGTIFVSWYPGTSTLELYQHVRRSVSRKMQNDGSSKEIQDIRILDESSDPPEESEDSHRNGLATPLSQISSRPPVSPSAAPSPNTAGRHVINDLNEKQIAILDSLQTSSTRKVLPPRTAKGGSANVMNGTTREVPTSSILEKEEKENDQELDGEEKDDTMLHSSDPVESMLREMMDLLVSDKKRTKSSGDARPHEKRQVIFVVANYFALFICFIFFSAELQARVPGWLKMMEEQLKNVENCSEDQEALFECVSRGDFAGLIASVGLWLSRSVVTKRIFLFGFDTPKKLWTVVYESLVTSICWGISYLFIRRGMNPDTRPRFVQKYWKDAVYGSLAGFNAAFLKQILKNLIPQDVVEDAIRERQLKFLGLFPSFA